MSVWFKVTGLDQTEGSADVGLGKSRCRGGLIETNGGPVSDGFPDMVHDYDSCVDFWW